MIDVLPVLFPDQIEEFILKDKECLPEVCIPSRIIGTTKWGSHFVTYFSSFNEAKKIADEIEAAR
jgi:hypothetical protein